MFRGKIIYLCLIALSFAQDTDVKIKPELASENMSQSEDVEINAVKRARIEEDDDPGPIQNIANGVNGAISNAWNRTMTKVISSPWFEPILYGVVSRLVGAPTESPKLKETKIKKVTASTTQRTIEETNNEEDDNYNEDEDK